MKTILTLICLLAVGCGADHDKERQAVCEHIEGFDSDECNAGDDFSPFTCQTALAQFQIWWRGDAQTTVNNCLSSSACYPPTEADTGPSIVTTLDSCLQATLITLKPTEAESQAANRYCIKASACNEISLYTIADCQEILLNAYGDGGLFLVMNDEVANNVANCDKSACADFDSCVVNVLHLSGATNTVDNFSITMPGFMRTK